MFFCVCTCANYHQNVKVFCLITDQYSKLITVMVRNIKLQISTNGFSRHEHLFSSVEPRIRNLIFDIYLNRKRIKRTLMADRNEISESDLEHSIDTCELVVQYFIVIVDS